jgi:alanine dehydrogenase
MGVIGRSSLENERRIPLHPGHFHLVPDALRRHIRFERGYGAPLGIEDAELRQLCSGVASREELLETSDVVLLPKPLPEDLRQLREGGTLWGWPHCVQQREITQVAIDRRQTLIAFESMFQWRAGGVRDVHLFYRNNEMAGYCGVAHAMELLGLDGWFGPPLKAIVLSFGSVSRGGLLALRTRGVEDVLVLTQRPPWAVHDRMPGARYGQIRRDDTATTVITPGGSKRALLEILGQADLIVNGILQDTGRPLMYLSEGDEDRLKPGALIVDVSCDEGMGFPFARPTSFRNPMFDVGRVSYYAVNHTPSLMWRSASWEISEVIAPYLESVMAGPGAWERDETVRRAIEIRDGVVRNPEIFSFQCRSEAYPHAPV